MVSERQPSENEYIAHTRSEHGLPFHNNLAKPTNHTRSSRCRVPRCSNGRAKVTREADADNETIVCWASLRKFSRRKVGRDQEIKKLALGARRQTTTVRDHEGGGDGDGEQEVGGEREMVMRVRMRPRRIAQELRTA